MLSGHNWVVLIVVPETDFTGFVVDSGWAALFMSVVVVLLVAGLTGLMAWRSVLADRRATAAATRQQALELRTQAFVDLAQGAATADGLAGENLQSATESAATACDAKRVAIWRLTSDRRMLTCEDCFDRTVDDHTAGLEFHRDEMPHLFAALDKGAPIDAADAGRDRRTSELFTSYLEPLGISRVYLAPIVAAGQPIGLLSVEDPRQGDRAAGLAAFCDALSILLALRFTAATPGALATSSPALAAVGDGAARRGKAAGQFPAAPGAARTHLAATGRRPRGCTRSLDRPRGRRRDQAADLDKRDATARPTAPSARRWTRSSTNCACRSNAAAPPMPPCSTTRSSWPRSRREADSIGENARCVATAMLALRDRLIEFEDQWSTSLDFRLAIDIGTVMVSTVGTEPPTRSLWGGALGVAKVLAATARPTQRRGLRDRLRSVVGRLSLPAARQLFPCPRPARCGPSSWSAAPDGTHDLQLRSRPVPSRAGRAGLDRAPWAPATCCSSSRSVRRWLSWPVVGRHGAGRSGLEFKRMLNNVAVRSLSTTVATGLLIGLGPCLPGRLLARGNRPDRAGRPGDRHPADPRAGADPGRAADLRPQRHSHLDRAGRGAYRRLASTVRDPGSRPDDPAGRAAGIGLRAGCLLHGNGTAALDPAHRLPDRARRSASSPIRSGISPTWCNAP